MKKILLIILSGFFFSLTIAQPVMAARLIDATGKGTVMVIVLSKPGAEDYTEYAEGTLKERLKSLNFTLMNPEMSEKVKKDRLLMQAIKNANATAMAKISADYGAAVLVRGTLQSVVSSEKVGGSWEGQASFSMVAIDTSTGEELEALTSNPMGSTENPAPMEDSSLASKQMAIRKAIDSVLQKAGVSSEILSQAASIAPSFSGVLATDGDDVTTMLFSPDGASLFAGVGNKVYAWDIAQKQHLKNLSPSEGDIIALAMNKNNSILAAGTSRGKVVIWDWPSGKQTKIIDAHSKGTGCIDFSPDGASIVSAGGDGIIKVWDVASSRKITEISAHNDKIIHVSFDLKGRTIVSASYDLTIKFWDIGSKKELRAFSESMDKLEFATTNQDRTLIAIGARTIEIDLMRKRRTDRRYLRLRDAVSGRDLKSFIGHAKDITSIAFFPGRRFLASASEDKTVRIWDLEKNDEVTRLDFESKVLGVAISRDGRYLAAGSKEVTLYKVK